MLDFGNIKLYRLIHIDNMGHVLRHGITHVKSQNANLYYRPIGDQSIINRRSEKVLPNNKKIGDYIPFYFGVRMPMLYVIQKGYNDTIRNLPTNLIYCITSVQNVIDLKIPFIFSDGHAVDKFSLFYKNTSIEKINTIVDFKAVNSKFWKDDKDPDLKRRKEAELLIEKDLPFSAICSFVTYSNDTLEKLISLGFDKNIIFVEKEYYF